MMMGFLAKPSHRPWLVAIFGLLLVGGLVALLLG
jgi:hypothetical protein